MLYCDETFRRIQARRKDERLSEKGRERIDELEKMLREEAEKHFDGDVYAMLKVADGRINSGEPRLYMSETHALVIQERLLFDLIATLEELAGPEPGAPEPFNFENFLGGVGNE